MGGTSSKSDAPKRSGSASLKGVGLVRPGQEALEIFRQNALKAHNEYRVRHQVAALKLDNEVSKIAQAWAEWLASTGKFEHSGNVYQGQRLGENIAGYRSSRQTDYTGQMMTDQWYNEISKHNFKKDFQGSTGHFSQLVWKDSTSVGFGRAQAASGQWITVANYLPAGNFIGEFQKNVFPAK